MLSIVVTLKSFARMSDLRSDGAQIGGRSVAAQGIQSLPLTVLGSSW